MLGRVTCTRGIAGQRFQTKKAATMTDTCLRPAALTERERDATTTRTTAVTAATDAITWNLLVKRLDVPSAGKRVYPISTGKADTQAARISPIDTVPSPPTTNTAAAGVPTAAKGVYPISTGKAGTQAARISPRDKIQSPTLNIAVATVDVIKRPATSKASVAIAGTVTNPDTTAVTYMPDEEATAPGWTMSTETHHPPSL